MSYPVVVREDGNATPLLKEETPPADILLCLFVQGNVMVKASDSSAKVD